jgi:hypothetical protein
MAPAATVAAAGARNVALENITCAVAHVQKHAKWNINCVHGRETKT